MIDSTHVSSRLPASCWFDGASFEWSNNHPLGLYTEIVLKVRQVHRELFSQFTLFSK